MTATMNPVAAAAVGAIEDAAAAPVTIPANIAANARELNDVRKAITVMKAREEALRDAVLGFLVHAGRDAVSDKGVTVSKTTGPRKGISREKLAQFYPAVLADVETSTDVTQVRVTIEG